MAIFGIGAYYECDVSEAFLARECACIGWAEKDAPPAHNILRHLRTGDIIYMKSFTPSGGLIIKAVGIVLDGKVDAFGDLGRGVPVRWVWKGEERLTRIDDKWPVRTVAIYEEHHPDVQRSIIELLLSRVAASRLSSAER